MTDRVSILADDLTGALDSAAAFTGDGPLTVRWDMRVPDVDRFALSSETRDATQDEAIARVTGLARAWPADAPFLKKIDSLLRGHVAAEIVATLGASGLRHAIFAPAFPERGRITRDGIQYVRSDAGFQRIPTDVGAELRHLRIATCQDAAPLAAATEPCVWIADAETDVDLREIVARGRALAQPLLWCGTAGLASALAGKPPAAAPPPGGHVLLVCGSDHPVAQAQVAAFAQVLPDAVVRVAPDATRLNLDRRLTLLTIDLPRCPRDAARAMIGESLGRLLPGIAPPSLLVVMGGETLRQCCDAIGAHGLEVDALVEPGIAHARLRGGAWDAVRVVSKSGAFGDAETLLRIVGVLQTQVSPL